MYIISIIRVVQVHRVSGNGEAQNWYEKVFDFLQTLTPKHLSDLNQVGFLFRSVRSDKAKALAGKSFHLDTCCFDSVPEQDFFLNVISQDDIKEVYFTGIPTHGQSDFHLNYIDPETHTVRNYYTDFLILTQDGEWLVVEGNAKNMMDDPDGRAKQEFAETRLMASRIKYHMMPHTEAAGWRHPLRARKRERP